MPSCVDVLKQWTGKSDVKVLYDSTVDEFVANAVFQAVKGRRNIAIVACTTEGDVFGGFYTVAVTQQSQAFYDPNIFVFSFESHGRCMTPQRFTLKRVFKKRAFMFFYRNRFEGRFLDFGVGDCGFGLGDEQAPTCCWCVSWVFDGMDDTTLTGKSCEVWESEKTHHCSRILAVQVE